MRPTQYGRTIASNNIPKYIHQRLGFACLREKSAIDNSVSGKSELKYSSDTSFTGASFFAGTSFFADTSFFAGTAPSAGAALLEDVGRRLTFIGVKLLGLSLCSSFNVIR